MQVGDPFTGKKLIEVSVELVERGLVESLQDCGAAGLASSLAEMARDGAGVDVHLDRVPLREEDLEPWEIMISESQERMVAVVRPEQLAAVEEVCGRWELHCTPIGEVTDTGALRAFHEEELLADIPAGFLTDECPRYEVERRQPRAFEGVLQRVLPLDEKLAQPNLRSRRSVYEQYDHLVGSRTVRRPGLDAAVLWLRNVACAGGEPLALTDCLNFGNPEKPEIGWELAQAIEGLARAAEALRIPIVSGNVSLYNETDGRAIPPTPVVGCVGLVPDVRLVPSGWREGDAIYVATLDDPLDLEAHAALVRLLWKLAPRCSLVHDVSDGGLDVALAEAALWSGLGADVGLAEGAFAVLASGSPLDLTQIGVAGGDTLLGYRLNRLLEVYG